MKNYVVFGALIFLIFLSVIMMIGCSYNVNVSMAHTEGKATDVIDDTNSAAHDFDADLDIPFRAISY